MMTETTTHVCAGPHVARYFGPHAGIRCQRCNIPVRPDPRVTETATRFVSPNLRATAAAVNARGVACRRCGHWTMRPARVVTSGGIPMATETDDLCPGCLEIAIRRSIDQFARLGRDAVADRMDDFAPVKAEPDITGTLADGTRFVADFKLTADLDEPELCLGCGEPLNKGIHGLDTGSGGCV